MKGNYYMKLYVDDISSYSHFDFQKMFSFIPASKKKRLSLYLQEKDVFLSLLGEYLLKIGLEELGILYNNCKFGVNENGKPFIKNNPIFYSISHFGTKAVCAISTSPIGVDIVDLSKRISLTSFSSQSEKKDFQKYSNLLLALKEAYIKMEGWNFSNVNDVIFYLNDSMIVCSDSSVQLNIFTLEKKYLLVICERM